MTGIVCAVAGCDYPDPSQRVCRIHREQLVRDLTELPDLFDELAVTLTRQGAIGRNSARGRESPLPFDPRASAAADRLRGTVLIWAQAVNDNNHHLDPTDGPAAARWLHAHRSRLLDHPQVETACEQLSAAMAHARAVTDRPPDKVYAGVCGATIQPDPDTPPGDGLARGGTGHYRCDNTLYAWPGEPTVRCRDCGTRHDVTTRRDYMLREIDQMLFTPGDIARLASYFTGIATARSAKLIDSWHRRGRITTNVHDHTGQPLYPFGEILALLLATPTRHRPVA